MLTGLSCKCLLHDALPDMVPAEITRRWSKALIERSVCTAFTADSSSCFPADAGGHSSRTSSPNHRSLALIKPSKSCQCLSIDRAPSSRNPSPLRLGFTLCMNVTQKEPIREHVEPVRELPNISLAVPKHRHCDDASHHGTQREKTPRRSEQQILYTNNDHFSDKFVCPQHERPRTMTKNWRQESIRSH